MPRADYSGRFNTKLTAAEEARYEAWAKANRRERDVIDYDMRGAWKANAKEAANGHFTDEFKKPNHPTFSDESIYNGAEGKKGGKWVGDDKKGWQFVASSDNVRNMSPAELQRYFQQNEPDARLVLPPSPAAVLYPNDMPAMR